MDSNNHPGGPLSRAERVILATMRKNLHGALDMLRGVSQIVGAVPGSQKIEAANKEALRSVSSAIEAIKTRKEGAPVQHAPAPTPCGDALTVRSIPPMDLVCILPAGHEGEHQSVGESMWTDAAHHPAPPPIAPAPTLVVCDQCAKSPHPRQVSCRNPRPAPTPATKGEL